MKQIYVGVIQKTKTNYEVFFPDFPTCITAGKTLNKAQNTAREALQFHVDGMIEDGISLPVMMSLKKIKAKYPKAADYVNVDLKQPDPETISEIKQSLKDFEKGKFFPAKEVFDELKQRTKRHYRSHREAFLEELSKSKKNRDIYLQIAIEDFEEEKNLPGFLLALRNIITAGSSIQEIADKLNLNRQTIYKALSPKGNPSFVLVDSIINALGMKLVAAPRTRQKKIRVG